MALSYIWGRRASGLSKPLDEAPHVVQDAIIVTKELHYRYLWVRSIEDFYEPVRRRINEVDQYCINQRDADEKSSQIAQMDKIYSEATLTIFAAAGHDADYGLPGVSVRARATFKMELDEFTLRCTGTYPHRLVEQSKWRSRGWTFQEALLSTRHLFFTEEQVFFECPRFSRCESINVDQGWPHEPRLFTLHTNNVSQNHFTQDISVCLEDLWSERDRLREFEKLVARYRRRELSHQKDTLNAILGILGVFTRVTDPIFHFYGNPVDRDMNDDWKINHYFAAALAWKDVEGSPTSSPPSKLDLGSLANQPQQFRCWLSRRYPGCKGDVAQT